MYLKTLADAERFLSTTPQANLNDVIDCIALFPNSLSLLFAAHKILKKTSHNNAKEIYQNWATEKDKLNKKSLPFFDKLSRITQELKQLETATESALESYATSFNSHLKATQKEMGTFSSIEPVTRFNTIEEAIKAYEELKLQLLGQQILASLRVKLTYTGIECALNMDANTLFNLLSESEICPNKAFHQANFKSLLQCSELKQHFFNKLTDEITALLFALARSSEESTEITQNTEAVVNFVLPFLAVENILVILKEAKAILSLPLRHQLFLAIFKKPVAKELVDANLDLFLSWIKTEENLPEKIIQQLACYTGFYALLENIGSESSIKNTELLKAVAFNRLQDEQPLQANTLCKIATLFLHDSEILAQLQRRFLHDQCEQQLLANPEAFVAFLQELFATSLLDNEVFKQKLIAKAAAEPFFFIQVLDKLVRLDNGDQLFLSIRFCFSSMLENSSEEIIPQLARYSYFYTLLENIGCESSIKNTALLKAIALKRLQDEQPLQANTLYKIATLFLHDSEILTQLQQRFLHDQCEQQPLANPETFIAFLQELFATSLLDNEVFKQKLIAKAAAEPFFFIQVLDKIAPQEDAINLSLTIKFCFPSLLESLAINDWPKVSEVVFSLLLSDDQENALEHKVKAMLEKGGEEVKALITKNFLKAIPNKQLELLCFTNNSFCKEVVEMLPKHIKTRLSRHQFEAFLTPNFLAALGNNRPLEKLFFSDVRFCNAVVEKMKDHTFTGPQISTMIKASKACKELEKILLEIPLRRLSKDAHTKFEHAVQTPQTVDSGVTRLIDVQKAVSLTSRLSVSAATYTESEAQTTPSLTEGLPTAASARAVTAALTVAPHSSPKPAKRPINPLAALLKEAQKSGEAPQPHREQPSTAQEHTALPDSANKTEVTASKQSTEADSKEQPQPAKNFAAELLKMFSQANRGLKDASLRVTPQTPAAQTATAAAQDQAPTPKQRPHKELFEKTSQANGLKAASLRDKPQTPATTEQQATSLQPATTAEDQTSTSQSQAISANASLGLLANLLIKTVPQQLTGRKELVPLEQNYLYLSSQAKAPTADLPKIKEEANKILKRINSALLELSLKGRRKACSESDAESDSENDWNDSDPKVEQQKLPPFTQQIDELQEKLKALIKEIDARIAATDSQSMPNIASPTAPRP